VTREPEASPIASRSKIWIFFFMIFVRSGARSPKSHDFGYNHGRADQSLYTRTSKRLQFQVREILKPVPKFKMSIGSLPLHPEVSRFSYQARIHKKALVNWVLTPYSEVKPIREVTSQTWDCALAQPWECFDWLR
jgi:hypothetical protein